MVPICHKKKNGGFMRKARILALLVLPALLCGCNADNIFGKAKPNYDSAYTIKAEIRSGELEAAADITRNGTGDYIFSFTEPDHLMGMSIALSEDELTASLGSMNITADSSFYTAIPETIADSIDSLSSVSAESITETEGVLTLNTETNGDRVIVTSDTDGGLLTLKCPSQKLSVKFSEQSEQQLIETAETLEIIIE